MAAIIDPKRTLPRWIRLARSLLAWQLCSNIPVDSAQIGVEVSGLGLLRAVLKAVSGIAESVGGPKLRIFHNTKAMQDKM
jgi:hypothetical protein